MTCQRPNCNNEFTPKHKKQKYCSTGCLKISFSKNDSKYNVSENEDGETIFNVDLYLLSVITI